MVTSAWKEVSELIWCIWRCFEKAGFRVDADAEPALDADGTTDRSEMTLFERFSADFGLDFNTYAVVDDDRFPPECTVRR